MILTITFILTTLLNTLALLMPDKLSVLCALGQGGCSKLTILVLDINAIILSVLHRPAKFHAASLHFERLRA